MDLKLQVKKILKQKFEAYCATSSLHGFVYLNKRLSASGVLVWTLIMTSCFGLCIFLWHMIWHKFVTDPTFTVVESIHYLTAGIPFPAVAVCSTELVYGPNTSNITNILKSRNFNDQQIAAFYRSFKEMRQKDYVPEPYLRKMYSVFDDISLTVEEFFTMVKKPCERLVVDCTWRSGRQRCSNLFRTVGTVAGHCCFFDINHFRAHAGNTTNFVVGTESNEALIIVIDSETILYDNTVKNSNTMLYIFDSSDTAGLLDSGETLTPSSYFEVNLDVWVIESSDNVKSLKLDDRQCTIDKDKRRGPKCMDGLVLNNIVKYCQCIPFSYRAEETEMSDYPACGWDRLLCSYQALEKEKSNIGDIIAMDKCYEKCDYVQYDNKLEYLRNCNNERKSSNTTLVVKFAASTCIKYRREVLYTWDQMLANLGGVFGLCLGGSIISIIELLWYIVDFLYSLAFIKKRRVNEEKTLKTSNLFTITQKEMKKKNSKKYIKPYSKYDRVTFLH